MLTIPAAVHTIDNNWVENQIRPWATERGNWLFAGSLRAGKRGAAVMSLILSLIRSAQLSGHDPYVYLKDVRTRLPTHKARDIAQLLPHHWKPANTCLPASTIGDVFAGGLPRTGRGVAMKRSRFTKSRSPMPSATSDCIASKRIFSPRTRH